MLGAKPTSMNSMMINTWVWDELADLALLTVDFPRWSRGCGYAEVS